MMRKENSFKTISTESKPTILTSGDRDKVIVGAYDGIYATSFRYPTYSLDTILAQRGFQYVDDMLNLAACRGAFDLKRYAVLKNGWAVEPCVSDPMAADYAQAKEISDAVQFALDNIRDLATDLSQDFRSILFDLLRGAWTGSRVGELDWAYREEGSVLDGKHALRGIYIKPNKQIGFDVDTRTLAVKNVTSYTPGGGYDFEIPVEKCIVYTHNAESNHPQGNGDWRSCFKHYWRIDTALKFWAIALERWGAPVFIAKYPAGSDADLQAAQQAADRIRAGSAAILPDNIEYELLTAPLNVFTAMESACRYDAEQIALAIHGSTLTISEGSHGATSAGSDVHQDNANIVYDELSRSIENVITQQVIRRFVRYNYGDRALSLCPLLRLRKQDPGDILKIAQALNLLIAAGNMPSQSKIIRNEMGLPPMDSEEETLLEEETKAKADAEQKMIEAKSADKTGNLAKMSDHDLDIVVDRMTQVIFASRQAETDLAA